MAMAFSSTVASYTSKEQGGEPCVICTIRLRERSQHFESEVQHGANWSDRETRPFSPHLDTGVAIVFLS